MNGVIVCTTVSSEGSPLALTRIGGVSLLERQARILRISGIAEILVLSTFDDARLDEECRRLCTRGIPVRLHAFHADSTPPANFLPRDDQYFVLCDGASLFDYSLPAQVIAQRAPAAAAIPSSTLPGLETGGACELSVAGRSYYFAGISVLPIRLFGSLSPIHMQNVWLGAFLDAFLAQFPEALLDLSLVSHYDYDLRRDESALWMPIRGAQDNPEAKRRLLDRAQKSVLDWPAWFIHRPIEKAIVYRLCEYSITPNQITLVNIVVAFAGIWAFAAGHPLTGLLLALAAGIIDGLDGKQARVKVMMTNIGKFEELSDRIYEYGWYLAIAYWLVRTDQYGMAPYWLFAVLFAAHGVEVLAGYLFKRKRHVQLDDFGPLERNFRWIGSRRNTNMWALIPFVLCGALYAGLWTVTVYYVLTVAFKLWRLIVHLSDPSTRRIG